MAAKSLKEQARWPYVNDFAEANWPEKRSEVLRTRGEMAGTRESRSYVILWNLVSMFADSVQPPLELLSNSIGNS
jgi:hypothetical protein